MNTILLLIVLGIGGHANSPKEVVVYCDKIDYNHYYSDGHHAYDQLIFYEWLPEYNRHAVCNWILVNSGEENKNEILKLYSQEGKYHVIRFYDQDKKARIVIKSKIYKEYSSDYDPERLDKKLFDEKYRRSLW